MPTAERDISVGEAGDVSIGDLHVKSRITPILESPAKSLLNIRYARIKETRRGRDLILLSVG